MYAASAIWFKIDLRTFSVDHKGLKINNLGSRSLYYSGALDGLDSAAGLADSEYGQAVEVDFTARSVSFGRDYLGHYPLLYACTSRTLYISDDFGELLGALRQEGVEPSVSEEALGLYFCTGYVPQGMTLYREVVSCEGASLYRWHNGQVTRTSLFRPVEIDEDFPAEEVGKALEAEVRKAAQGRDAVDVWCSGGLDSSIIACCAHRADVRAALVTLGYGSSIQERYGDGEQFFVREVSRAYGMPIREINFTPEAFADVYPLYVQTHNAPAIDTPVAPKYALAAGSRALVLTGEGGDNFFGGPKNNTMLYARERSPDASVGWLYALAHNRWASRLGGVLRRGEDLKGYVTGYFERLFDSYPGTLLRKLFYVNGLYKPASMIYAQSYYPSRIHGISVRHPMASLSVYRASFALPDHRKYQYPRNKIVLTDLYADALPPKVTRRKKSGTLIPLKFCLENLPDSAFGLEQLAGTGFLSDELLDRVSRTRGKQMDAVLVYGLVTLNYWLKQKGVHHARRISPEARDHRRSAMEMRV
jgi:asparagine synthetase B (glutamine-hydrolysing)